MTRHLPCRENLLTVIGSKRQIVLVMKYEIEDLKLFCVLPLSHYMTIFIKSIDVIKMAKFFFFFYENLNDVIKQNEIF